MQLKEQTVRGYSFNTDGVEKIGSSKQDSEAEKRSKEDSEDLVSKTSLR